MLHDQVQALLAEAKETSFALRVAPEWKGVADFIDKLAAALEEQDKFLRQELRDWAEDDTAIKELCRPFGIDVDGDSYGVPTMVDVVEQLATKFRATQIVLLQYQKNASRMDA